VRRRPESSRRGVSISDPRPLTGLRVCYFGRYDPHYSRNIITAKCLRRAGAEVVSIRDDRSLALRTPTLLRRALQTGFDAVIVGFRAHSDMLPARWLAARRGVPLIFDPLVSRYEERVVDRALVRPSSPLAGWYRVTDRTACRAADRILLETNEQIAYFSRSFALPVSRFRRLWLGADDEVMRPVQTARPTEVFTVFFYGRFSPLHGAEYIVRAAADLERRHEAARFVLVGGGQTYEKARALAASLGVSTILFRPPVPYAELAIGMAQADVCLGSFGTTARAERVIPNKVFDALAAGRPVLSADTPGVREALTHGDTAWLCPSGNSEAIADALVELKRNPDLRRSLAEKGHELFRARFSLEAITADLGGIIRELLS
jgi:glycosyltransferase involved in cell wall biosynthesis